jgi:hypothetical protein
MEAEDVLLLLPLEGRGAIVDCAHEPRVERQLL